ncbi:uncharacterized protein N7477_008625 [Penicillium maclennaniae]|uniref:uncharacterized protein n=1 Tax=Penicillium maclennaniae TaxID=1343394 RepID=UPI00254244E2|nr:uncharacterized protein N7477_008625 [Penicillium maclennaniae]KAJ5666177.1 hypothetical protein N7477_008625 [Penicillium maclennaniae]
MDSGKNRVIVAIDFGTTFSGVAWARSPTSHNGVSSEEVPSEVAYTDKDSKQEMFWCFQIPTSLPRLRWVQLGLDPDQKHGISASLLTQSKKFLGAPYPPDATPQSVTTDYLRALIEFVSQVIKYQVGSVFETLLFSFVITVPAVWSQGAKIRTLTCAEEAGLAKSAPILIVSEPEAAAIHALKASNPHGLKVDDTVVLCDAGGGTEDLITFTIVELSPNLRLREAAPGIVSLCGSTFLNRRFEDFLLKQLGSCPVFGEDTMEQATQHFELVAKRRFAGDSHDDFAFPVPGIADNDAVNVRRGRLHVTGTQIWDLMLPALQQVLDLVREQIKISKAPVKSVFLVGGFGQNPFLRHFIHEALPSGIEVLAPVDGWTAVVRGALSKTLFDLCTSAPQVAIDSREARKHYGTIKSLKFECSGHKKFYGEFHIKVMEWFIQKGDEIEETKPVVTSWIEHRHKSQGKVTSIKTTIYELDGADSKKAPLYFCREMRTHCKLHPILNRAHQERIPVTRGKDGEDYHTVLYQIHANYYSAHCDYSLWFEGQNHGTVEVEYL